MAYSTTTNPIQASPTVDSNGIIYIATWGDEFHAVYSSGTNKWIYSEDVDSLAVIDSSGTVYVGSGNNRICAIYSSGTIKWTYNTGGPVESSPVIDSNGILYAGCNDKKLYAIYTDSLGLDSGPWPMFHKNLEHTSRFKDNTSKYTINGYIKDDGSVGIAGASVVLSGTRDEVYIIGSDGYYEFTDLVMGDYNVIPEHIDYTFYPSTGVHISLNRDKSNEDFLGLISTYTISGYIKHSDNSAIVGTTLTLTGDSSKACITDSSGYYEFLGLVRGDYVVMPENIEYAFSPYSNTYTSLLNHQVDQDFTGSFVYTISGYLKDSTGIGIKGATVTLAGAVNSVYISDSNGFYKFEELFKGDYDVTPGHIDYTFPSLSKSFSQITSNQVNQDFTGILNTYDITGYIKDSEGSTVRGVTVTLSGAYNDEYITGDSGYYEFLDLLRGDYIVSADHNDCTFIDVTYQSLTSDELAQEILGQLVEIDVNTILLDFGEMEPGGTKTESFTIANIGGGSLSGTLSTDKSWIELDKKDFDDTNSEVIEVKLNRHSFYYDGDYTGTVNIESNGGDKSVAIAVSIVSDISDAFCYPSPVRFSLGQSLRFENFSPDSTIKIFSPSGHIVKTIQADNTGYINPWDGYGDNGLKVGSGTYIVHVRDKNGKTKLFNILVKK